MEQTYPKLFSVGPSGLEVLSAILGESSVYFNFLLIRVNGAPNTHKTCTDGKRGDSKGCTTRASLSYSKLVNSSTRLHVKAQCLRPEVATEQSPRN